MSTPSDSRDPGRPLSDEELVHLHDNPPAEADDRGHYRMLPLLLLFVFSGLILFSGTYVGHYSGSFSPIVHDARAHAVTGEIEAGPVDLAVLGGTLYTANCATCHLPTGLGLPGAIPPLANSDWVSGSPERLIRVVLNGLQGPVVVNGTTFPGAAAMPAFGSTGTNLSDDRIAAILTYVRQAWGNASDPVSPEQVAAVRADVGARADAWTAAELQPFE
jgi:mono/diheme cytochrome c family protein